MNVILYGKDFEVVIKLSILKWKDYPESSSWTINAITGILMRERLREITYRGGEELPRYYHKGRRGCMDLDTRQGRTLTA